MDIFEQEYSQRGETAADQFEKLSAELDGSNVMGKLNPGDIPQGSGSGSYPGGQDARSLEEGLRAVERLREGRGKITTLADYVPKRLNKSVGRDDSPLLSEGTQEPTPSKYVERMKTAALRNPFGEQAHKAAPPAFRKLAAGRIVALQVPGEKLSAKEKAGLITGGTVLGAGGLALGGYGVHKARQAEELGERAVRQATHAGQNVAEQAKIIGDKVSQAAEDLSATSKQVSKAVEPVVAAAEKGKQVKDKVQSGLGRVKNVVAETVEKAAPSPGTRERIVKSVSGYVPKTVRNVGGRVFRIIIKRGSDDSFRGTIAKLGSENRLRTLEGWNPVKE